MASQEHIRSTEIRVGIVAILGVIILVIGITLGRGCSVSTSLKTVSIHFASASGIDNTAPVLVNGLRRGMVSSVKPDTSGVLIQVTMEDVSDLRADATARLTILELTGGKKIEISTGKAAEHWNGSVLPGSSAPDFGDLMVFIGDISGDARNLLRRLDTISTSINTLLADGTFVTDVKQTMSHARVTVEQLQTILQNNRENLQTSMANLRTISDDIKRIVKDNDVPVTDLIRKLNNAATSTQSILVKADSTIERVDHLVRDVHEVVNEVRKGDGAVGKLIYDKNLAIRLDSTLSNLQIFIDQVAHHGVNVNVRLGTRP